MVGAKREYVKYVIIFCKTKKLGTHFVTFALLDSANIPFGLNELYLLFSIFINYDC